MIGKKKKVFILTGMVALLALTGVLNIILNTAGPSDDANTDTTYTNFFDMYRIERTASREQTMLYYDEIITSADYSAEAKLSAENAKIALASSIETERVLESLVKALGFEDAVVTSTTENINVIVKCEEMTATQATQIMQIVITEAGVAATNIRIIPTE